MPQQRSGLVSNSCKLPVLPWQSPDLGKCCLCLKAATVSADLDQLHSKSSQQLTKVKVGCSSPFLISSSWSHKQNHRVPHGVYPLYLLSCTEKCSLLITEILVHTGMAYNIPSLNHQNYRDTFSAIMTSSFSTAENGSKRDQEVTISFSSSSFFPSLDGPAFSSSLT